MKGAPLRFAVVMVGGWTTLRVMVLWPGAVAPAHPAASAIAVRELSVADASRDDAPAPPPLRLADAGQGPAAMPSDGERRPSFSNAPRRGSGLPPERKEAPDVRPGSSSAMAGGDRAAAARALAHAADDGAPRWTPTSGTLPPATRSGARLRGDVWLIARGGGGSANLAFGQLGASQAGARLTYAVDHARRVALSVRVSSPLRGAGREAGAGLDWQPTVLPLHLLVEQRVPLDGGRARPAAQLIAGVAMRLPLDLRLEGYGQAGAVLRRGGFADGAARVAHPLPGRLDLGLGAWGAAQRGIARVDVGPTLSLALPIAGTRLAADYRLRVAGRARPGSGPAVSLGSSF